MTTIEMLKELVDNGGMFETTNGGDLYITKLHNGAIILCEKRNDNFANELTANSYTMKCTWKPYVKPVDWTKVPIDTKVLCRFKDEWRKRHFAGVENGKPCTWDWESTSWSTLYPERRNSNWDEMKLAE